MVSLTGNAYGTVLVRDPRFSLTINQPDVVRANEPYSLFITLRNLTGLDGTAGQEAQCVSLPLDPTAISGATLVDTRVDNPAAPGTCGLPSGTSAPAGTATVASIAARDAVTVEYRLIARKNGRVTAAAFAAGPNVSGGTGVVRFDETARGLL